MPKKETRLTRWGDIALGAAVASAIWYVVTVYVVPARGAADPPPVVAQESHYDGGLTPDDHLRILMTMDLLDGMGLPKTPYDTASAPVRVEVQPKAERVDPALREAGLM